MTQTPDQAPDRDPFTPDLDPARTGPDPALAGAGLSATSTTASDMSPGDDAPGTAYGAPAGTGAEDVETTGTADPAP